MLGVEDERGAEGGDLRGGGGAAGEPLQERPRDGALGPGGDRPAGGEIDPGGQQRRGLAEEAFGLPEERLPRTGHIVLGDQAEHARCGAERVHRRGVRIPRGQPGEGVEHGRVDRPGRLPHAVAEGGVLCPRGQLAVKEQVGHVLEIARGGERFDVIPAVAEGALERSDRGSARHDAGEPLGEIGTGSGHRRFSGGAVCARLAAAGPARCRSGCRGS